MHPEAERLAEVFIRNFWSADHEIRWHELESEHKLHLDEHTVLVGKIDATGQTTDGDHFFADWKTASKKKARFMDAEKSQWRMNPQALTYGVLLDDTARRFMVRWALKTEPAITDFEWYTYTDKELAFWRTELIAIANQIRAHRTAIATNWPLNLTNCTRYGENYACPFRDNGCWKLNFNHVPEHLKSRRATYAGGSHVGIESELIQIGKTDTSLVVLDASRVHDWMECQEKYRRMWEGDDCLTDTSEALTIGTDFHSLIAAHLGSIKQEQQKEIDNAQ